METAVANKTSNRVGKLVGETRITLHSGDALSLFDSNRSTKNKDDKDRFYFYSGLPNYSAKMLLVIRNARLDDPVAMEILVNTEALIKQLIEKIKTQYDEASSKLDDYDGVLVMTAYSSSPTEKNCSRFNPYALMAVRALLSLDACILECRKVNHAGVYEKHLFEDNLKSMMTDFRYIIRHPFLYNTKVTRQDFDAKNALAIKAIDQYRTNQYIKQNDTRTNAEICLHYAMYDGVPGFI